MLEPRQLVAGGLRRWVVYEVRPRPLPAPTPKPVRAGAQTPLARLLAEDNDAGEELQVMRAFEPGAHNIIPKATLQASARGGTPHHLGGVP